MRDTKDEFVDVSPSILLLSLVQMKDKMVLSCLKLKQNSFKP